MAGSSSEVLGPLWTEEAGRLGHLQNALYYPKYCCWGACALMIRYLGQCDATPYQQPKCHPSCLWGVLTTLKSPVMPFCEHKTRFGNQLLITWMVGKSMVGEIWFDSIATYYYGKKVGWLVGFNNCHLSDICGGMLRIQIVKVALCLRPSLSQEETSYSFSVPV